MTARSPLGDICQEHDPATAPVVYPLEMTREGGSLRAVYLCECGAAWPVWWDMAAAGWTAADVDSFGKERPARKPYPVYEGVECPVCGNTEGHRDHGPYEEHPLDAELGGTPPETVHLMTCGRCHKIFDAEPEYRGGPIVHRPAYGPPSPMRRPGLTVIQGGQE